MRNERLFADANRTVDSLAHQRAPPVCSGLTASYIRALLQVLLHILRGS